MLGKTIGSRRLVLGGPFVVGGRTAVLILLAVGFCLCTAMPVRAATINVNTADDENNTDVDCSLREAVIAANTDTAVDACTAGSGADVIDVPADTYDLSTVGTSLSITSDVTIQGAGAGSTIIQAAASCCAGYRVFDVSGAALAVTFDGLTIRYGGTPAGTSTASRGAGIRFNSDGGTLTVQNSTLFGNSAIHRGGGIYLQSGNTTANVTDSRLDSNAATNSDGGGIESFGDLTDLTVTGTTFYMNSAGDSGGGIRKKGDRGSLTVIDSTFDQNSAGVSGGGICHEEDPNGIVSIDGCTFTSNDANGGGSSGGGGYAELGPYSKVSVVNSTFSGNTVTDDGGGIHAADSGPMTINNVTLTGNHAGDEGGGIRKRNPQAVTISNTIIAGNTAGFQHPDCSQNTNAFTSAGNNLIGDGMTGCLGFTDGVLGDQVGTTASPISPELAPLDDYGGPTETHALCTASGAPHGSCGNVSPAIDAGGGGCEAVDQRNVGRPVGPACDIGAFEAVICGDGFVDPNSSEECDEGDNNGDPNSCCDSACDLRDTSYECRASGGFCDVAEMCDGMSGACPGDTKATVSCRASAGQCDLEDFCDGINDDCPADAKSTAQCRGAASLCDAVEFCDGMSNSCPQDLLSPQGTICRPAVDPDCDIAEECDGMSANCPGNSFEDPNTECTDDGDLCTIDLCNGSGACVHTFDDADGDGVCTGIEEACVAGHGSDSNDTSLPTATRPGLRDGLLDCGQHRDVDVYTEESRGDDPDFAYPFGLAGFTLEDCMGPPPVVADVTLTFDGAAELSNMTMRKHGPLPPAGPLMWYTLADENPTANVVLAGQTISFRLTAAQPGDDNLDPNRIVDQGGPGSRTNQVPAPALAPWSLAAGLLVLVGSGALAIRRRRRLDA